MNHNGIYLLNNGMRICNVRRKYVYSYVLHESFYEFAIKILISYIRVRFPNVFYDVTKRMLIIGNWVYLHILLIHPYKI